MRLYPDIPARRAAAIAHDLAILLALGLLAWLAFKVHDTVDELATLGRGVEQAGGAVERGFGSAADAVDDTPVVGGTVGDALRDAGAGTGGEAAGAGRAGQEAVHDTAALLGLLTFALPAAALLSRWLPERIESVRRLTAAGRVLREPGDAERMRLMAMRAAFGLPFGVLLAHTPDPLGDLRDGRYEKLVEAELEYAGLRAPRA